MNTSEMFGLAGGVSYMFENNEGKRFIKRMSDMSYVNQSFLKESICCCYFLRFRRCGTRNYT